MRNIQSVILTITVLFAMTAAGQITSNSNGGGKAGPKTNSKMVYHGGPVRTGTQNLYFLYYGCWTDNCGNMGDTATMSLLADFAISIGGTPYMQINTTYPDGNGQAPSGTFIYGGQVYDDSYSHGAELTKADVVALISEQVNSFRLPQDSNGIYVILTSADISANDLGFCATGTPPFHGTGIVNGSPVQYAFIGNPRRCPVVAAAPFFAPSGSGFITPNGNFSGDAMAANIAHALNGILTNPNGNGWYDRYGLENADKCTGKLGTTYTTANGALANAHFGGRDWLIEQNWVNGRQGRCAMSN